MSFLEETINWANYADSSDKVAFLKALVQSFGPDELNCIRGILSRKRKKVFTSSDDTQPAKLWKGPRFFTGCNHSSARNPSPGVIPPGEVQPVIIPDPVEVKGKSKWCSAMVLFNIWIKIKIASLYFLSTEPWFKSIDKEDIIAFDVEAASRFIKFLDGDRMWKPTDKPMPKGAMITEDEPRLPKAAYLSVVNAKGEILLKRKIQHYPGTFKVDFWSKRTANIASSLQLRDGIPFHQVTKEFVELTGNKLHVTCAGGNDYRYLELSPLQFKRRFDLHSFYYREPGKEMSLRDIYFYHFGADFQRGPHDATTDARATMKIFIDGYCNLDFSQSYDFSEVPNLKLKAKEGLFWCAKAKKFSIPCECCRNIEI